MNDIIAGSPADANLPAHEVLTQLLDAAIAWNEAYPIGTPVMAYPNFRPEHPAFDKHTALNSRTRSRAWNLGHGSPVVAVEGHGGGILLTHIDVITDGGDLG
ncbi:hypothetical protein OS965_02100 [Streptomyces sp. H27-G5]|uniref:hypothetical protein n=1 Tax=Streptomyces sp. H27-G5 TaxID=2996698 RepID=UPI002271ED65|nr:hypothetical protein [Streptomyces sp. H27-G5]MCY0916967.1 hypothetical protein [Streptomyces sp. H27-G5]